MAEPIRPPKMPTKAPSTNRPHPRPPGMGSVTSITPIKAKAKASAKDTVSKAVAPKQSVSVKRVTPTAPQPVARGDVLRKPQRAVKGAGGQARKQK